MRSSSIFLLFISACGLLFLLTAIDASVRRSNAADDLQRRAQVVRQLGLTDLALFTEARYTRHLSQSDLHSAFQDHPMALEHFPSGSLVQPPGRYSQ